MNFNLLGKRKTQIEKYRKEVFEIIGKIKLGYYKESDGCDKLVKLNENIYRYAKNHGDKECLRLWRVVSRIGYSLVSEEHEYLGGIAEEEIYFRERLNFVLDAGIQQINLSKESPLEKTIEDSEMSSDLELKRARLGGNGRQSK